MNWNKVLSQAAHYVLAGLGVVLAGIATHITQGDLLTVATAEHWAIASIIVWLSSLFVQKVGPTPGGTAAAALILLALLPLASCSPPQATASIVVKGPAYYAGILNPGDTLSYTLSTAAVPGATGYKWTVTASATNGTWSGLLASATTTAPSITFTPSAPAWDSVTFSVTVVGTSTNRSSKAASTPTSWRVYRYLPAPVAVTVDSSHVGPLSLILRSVGDSLDVVGRSFAHMNANGNLQFCPFIKFGSGHVAPADTVSSCNAGVYVADFSASRRVVSAAEAAWLAGSCSPWSTCLGIGMLRAPADALMTHRA